MNIAKSRRAGPDAQHRGAYSADLQQLKLSPQRAVLLLQHLALAFQLGPQHLGVCERGLSPQSRALGTGAVAQQAGAQSVVVDAINVKGKALGVASAGDGSAVQAVGF